jgi:hypothetical protein
MKRETPALLTFDSEQLSLQAIYNIASISEKLLSFFRKPSKTKEGIVDSKIQQLSESMTKIRRSPVFRDPLPEMILCRTVDNFNCYLSDVLFILFRSRPETLRSSEQVTIEDVLTATNMDEFVERLAERKVESLSYQGFSAVYNYLTKRLGIRSGLKKELLEGAIKAIAIRNIIVHNRGKVNSRFLKETGQSEFRLGQNINLTIKEAERHVEFMQKVAEVIDGLLIEKFGYECFHKFCVKPDVLV